jgi:hypothetical protein
LLLSLAEEKEKKLKRLKKKLTKLKKKADERKEKIGRMTLNDEKRS